MAVCSPNASGTMQPRTNCEVAAGAVQHVSGRAAWCATNSLRKRKPQSPCWLLLPSLDFWTGTGEGPVMTAPRLSAGGGGGSRDTV